MTARTNRLFTVLGIAFGLASFALLHAKPWLDPVQSEGLQERSVELAAMFAAADPPIAESAAKQTAKPVSTPATASLPTQPLTQPPANAAASGKLNLNRATISELDRLPGIGPAKAQAILDYRSRTGGFAKAEDLMKVKGIGKKLYESIKPLVEVE